MVHSTAVLVSLMQLLIHVPMSSAAGGSVGLTTMNLLKLSGQVERSDVEGRLQSELAPQREDEIARLRDLEHTLSATYNALPKNSDGSLGHDSVRYVLHRLFAQRRGWFIRGLEPNSLSPSSTSTLQEEWVPSYLQALLERRERQLGEKGTSLQELAAISAAIEDLVAGEAGARLKDAFMLQRLPLEKAATEAEVNHAMLTYYVTFLLGGSFSAVSPKDADQQIEEFTMGYAGWPEAQEWLHEATGQYLHANSNGEFDFAASNNLAVEIGQQFYKFNDKECLDLKKTLMGLESGKAGRVRLSAFYQKALYSHWRFTEKADYLRTLGALDESEPGKLQVITANYLMSRPNCLDASGFYAVCCRNECEDLMGQLELQIGAPTADPSQVSELVSALPSGTVAARVLSQELLDRLEQVAKHSDGSVPLHGRLFAQWMHHAYPRECPYPHMSGTTSPQTPDEWMQENGQTPSEASADEMWGQVERDTCAVNPKGGVSCKEADGTGLPWLDIEELLSSDDAPAVHALESITLVKTGTTAPTAKANALAMAAGASILAAIFAVSGYPFLLKLAPGLMVVALVLVGVYSEIFDLRAFAVAFCGGMLVFSAHLASLHFFRPSKLPKADKCFV